MEGQKNHLPAVLDVDSSESFSGVLQECLANTVWLPEHNRDKMSRLLRLGLIPTKASKEQRSSFLKKIEAALEELNIEPLFFEEVHIFKDIYSGLYFKYGKEDKEDWLIGRETPRTVTSRRGVTRLHDNAYVLWTRRNLMEYTADNNGFPKQVIDVLERLQDAGLPVGSSISVWTPAELPDENRQATRMIDPMLVIEFAPNICIPLCRWNPSL